jgi:hypothetical protein
MVQAFPGERARIERGLAVAQLRRILETATTGTYLVECGDARGSVPLFHEATSVTCCCPDAQHHPDRRCKHSWALDILATASAIAAREHADQDADVLDLDPDAPIPFELTAQALAALGEVPPTTNTRSTRDRPQTGSQGQHGLSGEAACPRCGRVRGVVFDGEQTRCFGCHRHWIPTPPARSVA